MSVFKCKMCGGSLEITAGTTVTECEYCGTQQTLPRLDDDKRANMYDRANHFRRNNEFDKAMGIYEQILNEDGSDAEAYWSLVLCRYGIEYVEDPATRKRIPTVNRAQFTSIFDDADYKSAISHADSIQKEIYESEAKAINEIQKGILSISQKEEPFDVFICYKETDNNGRRTPDSVLAQELYFQLKQEGFKVFFSRITLEDKLGSAYEPYIFAALNSAKVMVVLGTKPEYFNAVWVKNEWSRYLSLIKQGKQKILIPAYRDMDPYDLPEEFSHLQAQDMSKLGFMQDLIRGIKKIAKGTDPQPNVVKEAPIPQQATVNVAPLLERASMALEDEDFERADEFCEQVLNQEPRNAMAYLFKLMIDLQVRTQNELKNQAEPFDNNSNYQKAFRFADDQLKSMLADYIKYIYVRIENERLEGIYRQAISAKERAKDEHDYKKIIELFTSISGWKDSDNQVVECQEKFEKLKVKAETDRLEKQRLAEIKRIEDEATAIRNQKIALIITSIVILTIAFLVIVSSVIIPNRKYKDAMESIAKGNCYSAYALLDDIDMNHSNKDTTEGYNALLIKALEVKEYDIAYQILCEKLSINIPEKYNKGFVQYILNETDFTNDSLYIASEKVAKQAYLFNFVDSFDPEYVKSIQKFNELLESRYQNNNTNTTTGFIQNNYSELKELWSCESIRSWLLSDNIINYFMIGSWIDENRNEMFRFSATDDDSVTFTLVVLPDPGVSRDYYDMENQTVIFTKENSNGTTEKVADVLEFTFISPDKIKCYCYTNNHTYTLTRKE